MKLAKLPDRTPIKITFSASARLNHDLHGYAALYRDAYGETASVSELIPSMLEAFLKSDPAFTKAKKAGTLGAGTGNGNGKEEIAGKQPSRARNLHAGSSAASTANFRTTTLTKGE
jgi:hypothetical protein